MKNDAMKADVLVDLFFTDRPWEHRIEAIAECGYRAIETWQGQDPDVLARMHRAGRDCGVDLVSIVVNFDGEDNVAPIRPENLQRFLDRVSRCADHALAAGCSSGIVTTGRTVEGRPRAGQFEALVDALRAAGEQVAGRGFRLTLEPLNTHVDHPGYFMDDRHEGIEAVRRVALPNVRLLYDIYHMSIMTGNHAVFIEEHIKGIGHFHLAGTPGRHEPARGETNYPFLLQRAVEAGYTGYVGLEYKPLMPHAESLRETRAYLQCV